MSEWEFVNLLDFGFGNGAVVNSEVVKFSRKCCGLVRLRDNHPSTVYWMPP